MPLGRSASAGTVDRANVDCPHEGRATRSTGPALRPYQTQAIGAIHDATANQRRVGLAAATESTRNGKAMVDLAKSEKDPRMKLRMVERLANQRNCKECSDYLVEILNK